MPKALIVSDSKDLASEVSSALLKDGISSKTVDWNFVKFFTANVSSYDYLLLLINKPSTSKTKNALSLMQKINTKTVVSGVNNLIDEKIIDASRVRRSKVVLFDCVTDLKNMDGNGDSNYCVSKLELSQTIVKSLYGFVDFKVVLVGNNREVNVAPKTVIKEYDKNESSNAIRFKYRRIAFVFVIAVFLPYLILLSLLMPLGASYLSYKSEHSYIFKKSLMITQYVSNKGKSIGGIYTRIPLVGGLYQQPLLYVRIINDASNLIQLGLQITEDTNKLLKNAMGEEKYDIEQVSSSLANNTDAMYRQLSFFETEVDQLNPWVNKKYGIKDVISTYRPVLQGASLFSRNLYGVLGGEEDKTYLILFQNNMELRPTGGFIGSIGLLSLSKGKLVDFSVYDVYDADGQLKGYVEPPEPIEKYLGEESWYLRDSNWDPDFPTTALRVEWFLDKSLQRDVDGVIAVNLEVAKSILSVTGPVELDGYDGLIDKDNMYEKVQYEVENNFFPGSRKKKNYLTALAQALVSKIEQTSSGQVLELVKQITLNANSRDLQAYFNDSHAQEGTAVLGWSGEVSIPKCENNCYVDWISLIEANLGVNKANHNITRNADLTVEINERFTKNTLYVKYTNISDDLSRIPEMRYKNYLRLLIPMSANMESVKLLDSDKIVELSTDIYIKDEYKEIGSLIEINPTETKTIIYTWSQEHGDINKLLLTWDKQSGVDMPITIRFKTPQNKFLLPTPAFNLTEEQFVGYNSELSGQFRSLIIW